MSLLTSVVAGGPGSPSGGIAPADATYITLSTNTTLTNERVLTGTANQVIVTDNGAGSTVVLSTPQDIATTSSVAFANVSLGSGGGLRTSQSAGNTLLIRARDVDGAVYTTFITLTANNTPTCDLSTSVTIGGDTIVSLTGNQILTNKTLTSPTLTGPALGVASATSITFGGSVLSNYLEGTYTPIFTLVGGAGNTVPVYTTNTGEYTRIGNRCYVQVLLDGDGGAEGGGTGQINISLPIAANASQPTGQYIAGTLLNNATYTMDVGLIGGGGTTIALSRIAAGTLTAENGNSQNNSTRTIRLNFWYYV